ncbi:MAG: tRNA 2-thiouridine(34) synthase MnmA [Candidatus Gastranaerophilales bacterium]|nr:tRNA 2-thiouridine(34) synthase MnmA [Candidatus Gastranaerophilales bacterium]
MKILVGLSGGVDSSVAALILKEQGNEVMGATMSIWGKNGIAVSEGHKNACYGPDEQEDIEEARKIANQLDIPYYVFDCSNQYEKIVLENFKKEYLDGHTPNPCVWCNALVKFGILPELAKKNGVEFDKFATGHYARITEENGRFLLKRSVNPKKDQSYFLYRLKQEQLKNIIMPLGEYTKDTIREIAKKHGLNSAEKPDSQDFYGGDYNELLQVEEKEGNIVDTDGKILGKHKGIWNYTIGQRKGLGVSSTEALYVLALKKETNEVVVGFADKTFKKSLIADKLNWIAIDGLTEDRKITAKIRSTQQPVPAIITPCGNDEVQVIFDDMQKSIAIGQSAVFYDGDTVLGGGVIKSSQ